VNIVDVLPIQELIQFFVVFVSWGFFVVVAFFCFALLGLEIGAFTFFCDGYF
jgi:hypothetical protein